MTPAARTESAIGLLAAIASDPTTPADRVAKAWFRKRRYAGSKDRAWVLRVVFSILRRRGELDWALGVPNPSPRLRTMAALMCIEHLDIATVGELFSGDRYGPEPLTLAERELAVAMLCDAAGPATPDWVPANVPPDLAPLMETSLDASWIAEAAALAEPPTVDLRVNTIRSTRGEARERLAADGIDTDPTPWSPVGLRLRGRANISACEAFRDGAVEVQDEGAQLAALLTDVRPGQTVLDACAGAGGKTLALAAVMAGSGNLVAFDADKRRLARARARLARAGALVNIAESEGSLPMHADRVLLDVPCSGSGTWRRNPALKWLTTPSSVADNAARQRQILNSFAPRVRPGGRMLYVTCSVFAEENEAPVQAFLESHASFRALPVAQVWRKMLGSEPPLATFKGACLQLTPHRTNTDGFFVAVLERVQE